MTRVNRSKAEDDPGLEQHGLDGLLGGLDRIDCGSTLVDGADERAEWSSIEYGCDNGFPH